MGLSRTTISPTSPDLLLETKPGYATSCLASWSSFAMPDHQEGPRGMENLNLGERSIVNQGNIRVSNRHYHRHSPFRSSPNKRGVCIGLPRDPTPVKRSGLLEKLKKMLPKGEKHEPVALWGLAGSGKSRLALHYAKERFQGSRRRCSVFWVHANNEATFVSDFRLIARKSKGIIDMSLNDQSLLIAVKEWIESQPAWVLIIDGADDVDFFRTRNSTDSFNPLEFIPDLEGYNGTIIWTSQDREILKLNDVGQTRGLKVGNMTTDEAVLLLQNTAHHGERFNNPEAALRLVQELECNPLVISHVANSMGDQSILPEEMLPLLADSCRRGDLLRLPWTNPNRPKDRGVNILGVLSGQAKYLAFRDIAARRIMAMIASLQDHNAIPLDMFFEADPHKEKEVTRRMVTRLGDLSILHQDLTASGGPRYRIDRLVQEALRLCLSRETPPRTGPSDSDTDTSQQNQGATEMETRSLRNPVKELLDKFPSKIHHATLSLCKPLAEAALDLFSMSQWAPPEQSTLVESADLLAQVGDYLDFCGRWRDMETPYQKALEFRQVFLGENHLQTLAAMDALAGTFLKLGYYQKALDLFSIARRIRFESLHLPETYRDTMAGNMNIASAHHLLGRFQLAESLLDDVLNLQIRTLGKEHLDTTQTMFARAELCGHQGSRDKQLELLREATEITSRLLGGDDPNTLKMASYLGSCLFRPQDWAEGLEILGAALDAQLRLLGEKHPHTLRSKMYLGKGFVERTFAEERGVQLLSESAQGHHDVLGQSHPHTIRALRCLTTHLQKAGNLSQAAAIHKDNLDDYSRLFGEVHPNTLFTRVRLAEIYLSMGRLGDSDKLVSAICDLKARSMDETFIQANELTFLDAERLMKRISERNADQATSNRAVARSSINHDGHEDQALTTEERLFRNKSDRVRKSAKRQWSRSPPSIHSVFSFRNPATWADLVTGQASSLVSETKQYMGHRPIDSFNRPSGARLGRKIS